MKKIGFIGLGVMGLPMAKNVIAKSGCQVYGFDVVETPREKLAEAGGTAVNDVLEIYKSCDVIMQMLPTHATITDSFAKAIEYGKPGRIIIDLSSTAPDILLEWYPKVEAAGMALLDAPVSGGNPMAIAGTLAIMCGGRKETFDSVKDMLSCMGNPVYTGGPAAGSVTKLVNNVIGGSYLVAMCEGYAFAAKAGIDLQTTFDATHCGFIGGPLYENKIPKLIRRDYTPGARVAVHQKDIHNAKKYAHTLGIDLPMTDVVCHVMDWMEDNGLVNEDQIAMVKYYETKMGVTTGKAEE